MNSRPALYLRSCQEPANNRRLSRLALLVSNGCLAAAASTRPGREAYPAKPSNQDAPNCIPMGGAIWLVTLVRIGLMRTCFFVSWPAFGPDEILDCALLGRGHSLALPPGTS